MTQTLAENRIVRVFESLKADGKKALMPFVVGGHPTSSPLGSLLRAVDTAGADIIEIGFPFSDPVADGPVIAEAMHNALLAGTTPESILNEVAECRAEIGAGLVAMISVSLIFKMGGPDAFAKRAKEAGIDGCIFPDISLEDAGEYIEACSKQGLTASLLVAPTTPIERAAKITAACSGFVYVLARAGITGTGSQAPDIQARVQELRQVTDLPLAVGFGISSAEHVRSVTESADAAIVGSALVAKINAALADGNDPVEAAKGFVLTLKQGVR
ncbi:MAG: tryptophan synthase subunit alpha [Phycisphaerales bacterium JB061]